MKTTEHLFYLINSLSKSEKRSFKLFAKQYSKNGTNNYTIIFDAIDKMQKYDHHALVKSVSGKINTKNISTLKVQLSELILKSLRQNSASYSTSLKLRQDIDYIDILFEKGLYSQARKLLEKTFIQAREQENYLALDRLSVLEYNIALKQSNMEDLEHYVNETFPEVSLARKTNDVLAEFEYLSVKMRMILLETTSIGGPKTQKRLQDIIDHPLLNVEIDKYPTQCQIDYHIIWGHYHYAFDHPQEMYEHRKRVVELIDGAYFEKRYWLTHARFLLIGLSTFKMFKEFDLERDRIMRIINEMPAHKKSSSFVDELGHTLNNIQVNRDIDEGNYAKMLTYINDLEEKYKDPSLQIDTNLRMVFYFNFMYTHLANGNYKKALKWSNDILNDADMKSIRYDVHSYIRLKLICIHFGLGNHELIRPLVKSAQRYLKKQQRDIPFLNAFLRFANNNLLESYRPSKSDEFDAGIEELTRLSKEEEGKISLEYFNGLGWLQSIRHGITMEEAVKGG